MIQSHNNGQSSQIIYKFIAITIKILTWSANFKISEIKQKIKHGQDNVKEEKDWDLF